MLHYNARLLAYHIGTKHLLDTTGNFVARRRAAHGHVARFETQADGGKHVAYIATQDGRVRLVKEIAMPGRGRVSARGPNKGRMLLLILAQQQVRLQYLLGHFSHDTMPGWTIGTAG